VTADATRLTADWLPAAYRALVALGFDRGIVTV
jgi:hypothetical protein